MPTVGGRHLLLGLGKKPLLDDSICFQASGQGVRINPYRDLHLKFPRPLEILNLKSRSLFEIVTHNI